MSNYLNFIFVDKENNSLEIIKKNKKLKRSKSANSFFNKKIDNKILLDKIEQNQKSIKNLTNLNQSLLMETVNNYNLNHNLQNKIINTNNNIINLNNKINLFIIFGISFITLISPEIQSFFDKNIQLI